MWDTNTDKVEEFLLKANSFHPTIKFTAEISETKNLYLMCEHILNLQRPFKSWRYFAAKKWNELSNDVRIKAGTNEIVNRIRSLNFGD